MCTTAWFASMPLWQVAVNDDCRPGAVFSCVRWAAQAGTWYRVQVDGYGGSVGLAVINVAGQRPDNDDFVKCVYLCRSVGYAVMMRGFFPSQRSPSSPSLALEASICSRTLSTAGLLTRM